MRKIVLVRHSTPLVDPAADPWRWKLSPAGEELAARLAPFLPEVEAIVSSDEVKAVQTASILAERLDLERPSTHAGLGEHRRERTDWSSKEDFEAAIAELFRSSRSSRSSIRSDRGRLAV